MDYNSLVYYDQICKLTGLPLEQVIYYYKTSITLICLSTILIVMILLLLVYLCNTLIKYKRNYNKVIKMYYKQINPKEDNGSIDNPPNSTKGQDSKLLTWKEMYTIGDNSRMIVFGSLVVLLLLIIGVLGLINGLLMASKIGLI
ncbi:hypothetical protein NEOKW01_0921 [Nematocida sp. AWRm80]|nr:hypothetical protein NEOKW01_0921 [Nematocida sp. AWRm80]